MICDYICIFFFWLFLQVVLYHVYVYTGDMEQADTDSEVYLCIYGKRGDSGLRLLHKSGIPVTFQKGMVSLKNELLSCINLTK